MLINFTGLNLTTASEAVDFVFSPLIIISGLAHNLYLVGTLTQTLIFQLAIRLPFIRSSSLTFDLVPPSTLTLALL